MKCRSGLATPTSTVLKPDPALSLPVKLIILNLANLKVRAVLKLRVHFHQEAFIRNVRFPAFLAGSNGARSVGQRVFADCVLRPNGFM